MDDFVHAWYIHLVLIECIWNYYHYIPLLLTKDVALCFLWLVIGVSSYFAPMGTYITYTFSAVPLSIGYCSGIQQWSHYIPRHECSMVVQCWIFTTYLSPDTTNKMEPQTYHFVKFLVGRVWGSVAEWVSMVADHHNVGSLSPLRDGTDRCEKATSPEHSPTC